MESKQAVIEDENKNEEIVRSGAELIFIGGVLFLWGVFCAGLGASSLLCLVCGIFLYIVLATLTLTRKRIISSVFACALLFI